MRFFKHLLLLILFISSCSKTNKSKIYFSGDIPIKLSDTLVIKTDNRKKLHIQKDTIVKIYFSKSHKFTEILDIPKGYYNINLENNKFPLYLENGFNLKLKYKNYNIRFDGKGSVMNNYLQDKQRFEDSILPFDNYYYNSKLRESKFLKHINSIKKARIDLIRSHNLDDEFVYLEKNLALILNAHELMNYSFHRKKVDENYIKSQNYPKLLKEVNVNDERLLDIHHFKLFLFLYVIHKVVEENENYSRGNSYLEYINSDSFPVLNTKIKEEVLFKTADNVISDASDLQNFYHLYMETAQNEDYKKIIKAKYLNLIGLKHNDNILKLELTTIEGYKIKLEDFKNHILYIDIWASWCKPCIEEMPSLFSLQEKYKDDAINVFTIAIDSNKKDILKLIDLYDLKTINVFDKENEKKIKDLFQIEGIPRYLLIGKNGKLIEHSAKKPSDKDLINQIDNLLEGG